MTQKPSNRNIPIRNSIIIILSFIGLALCIAVLFPHVRQMIMDYGEQIVQHESATRQTWLRALFSYALGGIVVILFFDYCTLTTSGRALVRDVKQEIKDGLSGIDFRSFLKPLIILSGVYLLGIFTIIRANFLYLDDIGWAISGVRNWYNFSRYVIVFLSYFVQPEISMTDISPIPQLLAAVILACSSILFVYIFGNKKITLVKLLASVPLGLSPYFLECLSYKFAAPYMALPILASIIPFLLIEHKKAFFFTSVASMLIMCMTYQALSGVYPMIVVLLAFMDWNSRKKSIKEILSFMGLAAFAFGFSLLFFKFFLMRTSGDQEVQDYASVAMHPLPQLIPGLLHNLKMYASTLNQDLGLLWKIGIVLIFILFILKSVQVSLQGKIRSFIVSVLVIVPAFVLSYGIYSLLKFPYFYPRGLVGFGVFLAILSIYVVTDYKKTAMIPVLALSWCFFVFAFSYGNALADQMRYAEFRISLLLQDLNSLQLNKDSEKPSIQFNNPIDFTPSVKNIAKQNPIIERLVPRRLGDFILDDMYCLIYNNFNSYEINYRVVVKQNFIDFTTLNLPVVTDSYYHTIQSDGNHILITLKH